MNTGGVRRILRGFDKGSDNLVEEIDVTDIPLSTLQDIFSNPPDDLMYECHIVDDEIKMKITGLLHGKKMRTDLAWYLDTDAE